MRWVGKPDVVQDLRQGRWLWKWRTRTIDVRRGLIESEIQLIGKLHRPRYLTDGEMQSMPSSEQLPGDGKKWTDVPHATAQFPSVENVRHSNPPPFAHCRLSLRESMRKLSRSERRQQFGASL